MTAPVTNMTFDATSSAPADRTVLAALVLGNLSAARAFGFDAERLAVKAGITTTELETPDGRVPFEQHLALLEAIEGEPRALEFGLWLGHSVRCEALGVVGYVMQHAPDVRAALWCFQRFQRLLGDGIGPQLLERGEALVLERVEPPRIARLTASSIAAPLGTVTLLHELLGGSPAQPVALEVSFQHPPVPDQVLATLQKALCCPIRFNADATRLVLRASLLDCLLRAPNPGLFDYLGRHATALQQKVQVGTPLSARVRELIAAQIRSGEPAPTAVARTLALSERTLQRRLQGEGTNFAALVDDVRTELARLYLSDDKLAIFEVAFLLGYSEPSAFNRAFKRWTGQSPSQFRGR